MSVTTEKTVRQLAVENPAATRIFEKLGIDYCCGGNQSVDDACRADTTATALTAIVSATKMKSRRI